MVLTATTAKLLLGEESWRVLTENKCSTCGWVGYYSLYCRYCGRGQKGGDSSKTKCESTTSVNCSVCGGDGKIDIISNCGHGYRYAHSYCSHGKVGVHD